MSRRFCVERMICEVVTLSWSGVVWWICGGGLGDISHQHRPGSILPGLASSSACHAEARARVKAGRGRSDRPATHIGELDQLPQARTERDHLGVYARVPALILFL